MIDHGYHAKVVRLGIPDLIIEHGSQPELWKECGYDAESIQEAALKLMKQSNATKSNVVG
jgi:1-deoxy-D-xylulose-5-phosphate synthase